MTASILDLHARSASLRAPEEVKRKMKLSGGYIIGHSHSASLARCCSLTITASASKASERAFSVSCSAWHSSYEDAAGAATASQTCESAARRRVFSSMEAAA